MKKVLRKSNLVAGVLILVVVCLGIVLAGDVIVKEGTLEAENIDVSEDLTAAALTVDSTNNTLNTSTTYNNVGIGLAATSWGKLYVYGAYGFLSIDGTDTYPVARFRTSVGGGVIDFLGELSGHSYIMNGLNATGLKLGTRNAYASSVAIDIKPDRQVLMPYVYSDTVGGKRVHVIFVGRKKPSR